MSRLAFLAVLVALAGCGDEPVVGQGLGGAGGPVAPQPVQPGQAAEADQGQGEAEVLRYRDDDFVEADTNRDPFRSFAQMFEMRDANLPPQREVLMPTTSIEQMRLIAIITGTSQPRAMLVDPNGVGHVVKRSDFIGRAEVVQTGGAESLPVNLNWRVDRIRPNEVVLTREDTTAPDQPPLTRVIPLYEEGERE